MDNLVIVLWCLVLVLVLFPWDILFTRRRELVVIHTYVNSDVNSVLEPLYRSANPPKNIVIHTSVTPEEQILLDACKEDNAYTIKPYHNPTRSSTPPQPSLLDLVQDSIGRGRSDQHI